MVIVINEITNVYPRGFHEDPPSYLRRMGLHGPDAIHYVESKEVKRRGKVLGE